MYDVAIIGCGVIGADTAYALSRYDNKVVILEAENDVADCTTKANSAILHAGYDPAPGTRMARLNVRGVALAKEQGLRTSHLTTHCMFYEIPALGKMLILTDGGVNTFPDLEKKAEILENAAAVLQALGYTSINAACICGAEQVNPKVQSTVDADALSKMTDRWAKYNMQVCGPVALDLAVSKEACKHKHFTAPGAGDADILLVPNYEVGNGIGKAASLFGGAKNAGIILGAKVPIVLVSRSDSAESKLASIAAGSVLAQRMHLA